jgi:polar amino acid transport system substrate-binding protein
MLFRLLFIFFIAVQMAHPSSASTSNAISSEHSMVSGWFPFEPYMYMENNHGQERLTGLDIRMIEEVLKNAGYSASFDLVPWKSFLADIKSGKRQIAPFATDTPEREKWGYFTAPYRWEENVFYVRQGTNIDFQSIPDLLKIIKDKKFKVGIMDGFIYADSRINDFIHDPKNAENIIEVKYDADNLSNLVSGKIDGFFTDRLAGATMVWRSGERHKVEERVLGIHTPIHFIMSKQSTTPEMVETINNTIKKMRSNGEHSRIMREYILPVLLMQTIDRPWFFWVEVLAIIAFVLSGVIIAERENLNLLSAFGLSVVPSFGGGLIRDVIVNRSPVGVLVTPRYIFTVGIVFIIAVILINLYDFLRHKCHFEKLRKIIPTDRIIKIIVDIFDALGTSAFTVIGVLVGVMSQANPLWVWGPLFAVMTGVGGSTIRNALVGYRALGNETTYAEIPLITGFFLSLYLQNQTELINPTEILWVVIATIVIGFLMHILVYFYRIPALKIHFFEEKQR